jgi:hypothetical protein
LEKVQTAVRNGVAAIGICTVQPMFVYDVISRRPIITNILARTGSRKRSEMRAATWLPTKMFDLRAEYAPDLPTAGNAEKGAPVLRVNLGNSLAF